MASRVWMQEVGSVEGARGGQRESDEVAPNELLERDVWYVVIEGGWEVCMLRIDESIVFAENGSPHPENQHCWVRRHLEDNPEKLVEVQQPLLRPGVRCQRWVL